jgi:hypothetical protein
MKFGKVNAACVPATGDVSDASNAAPIGVPPDSGVA